MIKSRAQYVGSNVRCRVSDTRSNEHIQSRKKKHKIVEPGTERSATTFGSTFMTQAQHLKVPAHFVHVHEPLAARRQTFALPIRFALYDKKMSLHFFK